MMSSSEEILHNKYSKNKGRGGVLIGNWVEERSAYEKDRLNIESQQEENKKNCHKNFYCSEKIDVSLQYAKEIKYGRREAKDRLIIMEECKRVVEGDKKPCNYESVTKADFKWKKFDCSRLGKRVMKTSGGLPVKRDALFLSEAKLVLRDVADRYISKKSIDLNQEHDKDNMGDIPVSIYTEAIRENKYTSSISYGTSNFGYSPFGKNTNFTKPIEDYSKILN